MRTTLTLILLSLLFLSCNQNNQLARTETLFDNDWKFQLGDVQGAENPSLKDDTWRTLDLPHDWSIENLPNQEDGNVVGHSPSKALELRPQVIPLVERLGTVKHLPWIKTSVLTKPLSISMGFI